jgi:hypothetical protein
MFECHHELRMLGHEIGAFSGVLGEIEQEEQAAIV